ncbi:uncharacterized protein LOC131584648 [Poecile atricapillus]|uniref:uncharacterized protein LOC131584648 n=1 Tax=Poecile atricapillus TaxID=48891 RepID=UPI002738A21F|nr:uncharacterized protein LOC131584648 [Poecile atricapillus]
MGTEKQGLVCQPGEAAHPPPTPPAAPWHRCLLPSRHSSHPRTRGATEPGNLLSWEGPAGITRIQLGSRHGRSCSRTHPGAQLGTAGHKGGTAGHSWTQPHRACPSGRCADRGQPCSTCCALHGHSRIAAPAPPGGGERRRFPDPGSAGAQWKFCPLCEFSSRPAVPRCLAQAAALSSPEIVRKEHPRHGNEAAGAGRVSAAPGDAAHVAPEQAGAPPSSKCLLGAVFKAFPAPSTSSGHRGSPGPRAARQSPEPDGAPEVEAERELTALSRVLFCSPRRAPAGLCQLTGSLNIARESGFASGAVNRVTRNEKEYL